MRKRYIVAVDSSTKTQNDAFMEFIKRNGLGWWHWLEDFWLLSDYLGKLSVEEIRDALGETHSGIDKIVIELNENGDTWAGYGPNTKDRDMFHWLEDTWKK